jgi:hypothetical protein
MRQLPVHYLVQHAIFPRHDSEFPKIEVIAGDAEIFNDVGNDAARHVAWMPRKRDDAVRMEWIGIVPVTAGASEVLATDVPESSFKLPTVIGRVLAHESGREDEFVAERRRDRSAGFQQSFQMRLGGLLKPEQGLASVAPVSVAAGQEARFGDPHTVFILPDLHLLQWNNHPANANTMRSGRKATVQHSRRFASSFCYCNNVTFLTF